jgi:hypothetical protein
MIKRRHLNIAVTEWPDETNPKLRFGATIDFEFPVPRHGDEKETNMSVATGVFGSTASKAVVKLLNSNVVQKYIIMMMEK